jgi:hypothetical protein
VPASTFKHDIPAPTTIESTADSNGADEDEDVAHERSRVTTAAAAAAATSAIRLPTGNVDDTDIGTETGAQGSKSAGSNGRSGHQHASSSTKKGKVVPAAAAEMLPAPGEPVRLFAEPSETDVNSRRQTFSLNPTADAEPVFFCVPCQLPAEVGGLEPPIRMRLVHTRPSNHEVVQVFHIFDGGELW